MFTWPGLLWVRPRKLVSQTILDLASISPDLSESDLVYADGFDSEQRRTFEECVNHPCFRDFERTLVAGRHHNWVDDQFETLAECKYFPTNSKRSIWNAGGSAAGWMRMPYCWICERGQVTDFLDPYSKELDTRIVKLPYTSEQGLMIPRKRLVLPTQRFFAIL